MANEKLISANAFWQMLDEVESGENSYYGYTAGEIEEALRKTPTVDAVEVVRCKDCEYFHTPTGEFDYCHCTHSQWQCESGWAREIKPTDFCSYGERGEVGHGR